MFMATDINLGALLFYTVAALLLNTNNYSPLLYIILVLDNNMTLSPKLSIGYDVLLSC